MDRKFFIPDITLLEFRKRRVQMTPQGGQIVRELYCEPYPAHSRVLEALLGTVDRTALTRTRPHADPYYPFYYCSEALVEQLADTAMAASPSSGFRGGNIAAINMALDTPENPRGTSEENPKVTAGAIITATYRPLVFLEGLPSGADRFDFVDPVFEPVTMTQVVGKQLKYIRQEAILGAFTTYDGPDTATLREVQWHFSIRRMMCPKIPSMTIGRLANTINKNTWTLGQHGFPPECIRFDGADIANRISPNETLWHDITLNFSLRTLRDSCIVLGAPIIGETWTTQPVGWNRIYGSIKDELGIELGGYMPVGWNDASYVVIDSYRFKHKFAEDVANPAGGKLSFDDLFKIDAP